ncbi:MAG: hypothetical protein RL660_2612 [Bacteroidota bacterium]|jgi:1-aminocyclopropane-1-carboxylate deaminase
MATSLPEVDITAIQNRIWQAHDIAMDMLRLDLIHPIISGNKYLKLLPYLDLYRQNACTSVISYGGAYSNYLHALAYTCYLNNIPCTLVVRGEQVVNDTLHDCAQWGATIQFLTRSEFDESCYSSCIADDGALHIPFGGHDKAGLYGLQEILEKIKQSYTHYACSIGTGTTINALISASKKTKAQVLGFMASKDAKLADAIAEQGAVVNAESYAPKFGGIADNTVQFMLNFYEQQQIKLDMVYTGKMMQALHQMIVEQQIPQGARILAIHTGGLQGNRSHAALRHLTAP